MVQYGGIVDDGEDDEIEQAAVHKSTVKDRVANGKKKAMVHLKNHISSLTNHSIAESHQDHGIKISSATYQKGSSKWRSQMATSSCSPSPWN